MPRHSPRWANSAVFVLIFLLSMGAVGSPLKNAQRTHGAAVLAPALPVPAMIATLQPVHHTQAAEADDQVAVPASKVTVKMEPTQALPVLMYHVIGDGPNNLFVSEAVFRQQMVYLKEHSYHTVSMDQVYAAFHGERMLPEHPVVVTFDDGYVSHYAAAFPILKELGLMGTFYVSTHLLETERYMTWKQVVEMDRGGMEIASHTRTHADVRSLTSDRLQAEIVGAKKDIEEHLGHPIYGFCYPGGFYSNTAIAAIKDAGYRHATTTVPGLANITEDAYQYSRVRVYRGMSLAGFAASLEGRK